MNSGRTVFSQLIEFLPHQEFQKCVARYGGGRGLTYAYDFENHLVQKGGLTIVYDGGGNRVAKTMPGGTTRFLVDQLNPTGYAQVVEELQSGTGLPLWSLVLF